MAAFSLLKSSFEHTPRTLKLVWRSSWRITSLLGIITLISAVIPLAIAYTGKRIVDSVVAADVALTLRWTLLELAFVVGQAFIQRGLALLRKVLGARLSIDINTMILEKALSLDFAHFEDATFYDQLTRARREASSRPLSVVSETFQLIQNLLTLSGYVALLVAYSGFAVLGLVLAAIPAAVGEMRFSRTAFRMRNWRSPDSRKLNYLEYVLGNERHVKEVKLFGLGKMLLDRYRILSEAFYQEDSALAVRRAGWAYVLSLIGTGAFYAFYAAMALAAARRTLTLGNLTLYITAFRQGQQAFQSCLTAIGGMYEDNLYMSNLFSYMAIPTRHLSSISREPGTAVALPPNSSLAAGELSPITVERGIRFDGVGFKYPNRDQWALRDLHLFIPQGQSLALVGQNGAGKTTFIKLLTRLYEPSEGRILLDGVDIQSMDVEQLRRRVGVVFQDFNEYQFSARENVGVGSVEHIEEAERIARAVEQGGATEMMQALPAGLETQLGGWFKEGTELSGGQWQKIALARAFMREEADILVLDEPTSALDAEAEHQIFERFRALARGRTTILISHRFPTVRMADRILVIEQGQILEEGTHTELVAKGQRYAQLFTLQAKGYL